MAAGIEVRLRRVCGFTGPEAHETFADFGFVEGIGIEGTTVPIGQFVVVVVLGVFERFEEGVEARQFAF